MSTAQKWLKKMRYCNKKWLTKCIYLVICIYMLTVPCSAASKYELKFRQEARRISLEIVDILAKVLDNRPLRRGFVYIAPSEDATIRNAEMMHNIRDNQKVFIFRIIYYF